MDLERLGFSDWFRERRAVSPDDFQIMRVSAVHKDNCTVTDGEVDVLAEITGTLRFQADTASQLPTVGDWVSVQRFPESTFVIIHEVLPRKTVLKRKVSGKKIEYQLIAANIDVALLVQALDENFNLRRLERYLALAHEGGIEPVALLSKMDLLSREQLAEKVSRIHERMPGLRVIPFSNLEDSALDEVRECLQPGRTFCLLGSSGVGKTTLLNNMLGADRFETREIREHDGRGRHTTTRRELLRLPNGALLVDTPGMRELGNIAIDQGIDETFAEIAKLARMCRFNDCSHNLERGCAVQDALSRGELSEERYGNYLKMKKESAFHGRSYLEQRRKDKSLGKLYKSVQKRKRKSRGRE